LLLQIAGVSESGAAAMSDLLTPDELAAMDLTGLLANQLARIVGQGDNRQNDLAELLGNHIHGIQHAIMSQAAARAYPEKFRLLGESLR
jgi:hypothetical protein